MTTAVVLNEPSHIVATLVDGTRYTVNVSKSVVTVIRPGITVNGPVLRVIANTFATDDGIVCGLDLQYWPEAERAIIAAETANALEHAVQQLSFTPVESATPIVAHLAQYLRELRI